jgi:prolyl 4-hydroxylase
VCSCCRYLAAQEYKPHYDAFDLSTEDGRRFAQNGGQRVATVLIYLNDVPNGGKTAFQKLGLSVTPRWGAVQR